MKQSILAIVILVIFAALPLLFLNMPKKGDIVRIDCTLSEISPDFTNEMRQVCRDARRNGL
jgi:short subunit fatty acids transporter